MLYVQQPGRHSVGDTMQDEAGEHTVYGRGDVYGSLVARGLRVVFLVDQHDPGGDPRCGYRFATPYVDDNVVQLSFHVFGGWQKRWGGGGVRPCRFVFGQPKNSWYVGSVFHVRL